MWNEYRWLECKIPALSHVVEFFPRCLASHKLPIDEESSSFEHESGGFIAQSCYDWIIDLTLTSTLILIPNLVFRFDTQHHTAILNTKHRYTEC